MVDVDACGGDAPADRAGTTVTGGSGTVTYSCAGMGCSIGGPTKGMGRMADFATAWIMVFHLLSPSIRMPAASLGVVLPGKPWCGRTWLWYSRRPARIVVLSLSSPRMTFSRCRTAFLLKDSIWLLFVSPTMWMWLPCVDSDCIQLCFPISINASELPQRTRFSCDLTLFTDCLFI